MSEKAGRIFPNPDVLLWVENETMIEVGPEKVYEIVRLMMNRDWLYPEEDGIYKLTIQVFNHDFEQCDAAEAIELALAKFEMPTMAELTEMDVAGKLMDEEKMLFVVSVAKADFEALYDRLRNGALATKCKFRYRSIRLPFHASMQPAFMVFHAREYADDRPGPMSQAEARAAFKQIYPDIEETTRIRLAIDMDTNVYAIEDNPQESGPCRCVMLGHRDFGVSTDMLEFEYDSEELYPKLVAGEQNFRKGYSEMDVRWHQYGDSIFEKRED